MSVLLVDIGNTRIKWARWSNGRLGRQQAAAHLGWRAADFFRVVLGKMHDVERIVAVSVAGSRVNGAFATAARRGDLRVEFVTSQRRLAGVTTRYADPWRLGTDRLVAVIGAWHMLKGRRAACVVDVGTTLTVDLVDRKGVHRGGAIVPAPQLMVDSLLRNTSGILKRSRGPSVTPTLFSRSTRDAVEQGARYAAAAVVDRAVTEARQLLGTAPLVLLTGGAAQPLRAVIRSRHIAVPDLVLRGLAVIAAGSKSRKAVAKRRGHS
jgi:type III pantothenate kinase